MQQESMLKLLQARGSRIAIFIFMFGTSVGLMASTAAAQARLEISIPKRKLFQNEPLNLTVKLTNTSSKPYYVSGDVAPGINGMGHDFGAYRLEIRKQGALAFETTQQAFVDGIGRPNLSTADFIVLNRLILLSEGMFVGITIRSDWFGFALLGPGSYSIRMVYLSPSKERAMPQDLRFPILRSTLLSNVIDIEIERN